MWDPGMRNQYSSTFIYSILILIFAIWFYLTKRSNVMKYALDNDIDENDFMYHDCNIFPFMCHSYCLLSAVIKRVVVFSYQGSLESTIFFAAKSQFTPCKFSTQQLQIRIFQLFYSLYNKTIPFSREVTRNLATLSSH